MAGISGRPQAETIMMFTGKNYPFIPAFCAADTHWSATNSVGLKFVVFLFHLPTHDWYMYSFQNERTHKTLLPDRQAGGWRELF